jgi:hypothetical protein
LAESRGGGPLSLLLLAWALSLLVTLGGFGGWPSPMGSPVALAALPWLALVGVPSAVIGGGEPWRRVALALGLAAPGLGLSVGMALSQGAARGSVGLEVSAALVMIGLLAVAAERPRRAYGPLWLGVVVVLPLLAATLAWDGAPGGGFGWLTALARSSPLGWAFERAGTPGPCTVRELWPPLAGVLVLVGLARGGGAK